MKYRTQRQAVINSLSTAFEKTAVDLGAFYTARFEDDIWDWPRPTHRVNGETVTAPRNIVDTGELQDSQRLEFEDIARYIGKVKARYIWADDKAAGVFLGETVISDSGKAYELPARNLPVDMLALYNFAEAYQFFAQAELKGSR
jgi:hypothetical protein